MPLPRAALRPVWPLIGPAMKQMVTLRDRWARGIARVRDLLRLSWVSPELRDEAHQILGDEPAH